MQLLTGLLCVALLLGLTSAAKLDVSVDEAVAALAADMSSSNATLPGFSTDWISRAYIWREKCNFNCYPGMLSSANSFVRKGDPVSEDQSSVTALLKLPKINFDFGSCRLQIYDTGIGGYNGFSQENEVLLKMSLEDKETHCEAKVLQLEMNYPTDLEIVRDSWGVALMKDYGALPRCLKEIKNSVYKGVNEYYSTFVNRIYNLTTRC